MKAASLPIPLYRSEPRFTQASPPPQTNSQSKAHGYTIQDFLAFWILNNIPQEKRHGAVQRG